MAMYMVESYVPRASSEEVIAATSRVRQSAEQTTASGRRVRYLSSTLVPSDETVFRFFDGCSLEDVQEAIERARVSFERIVEAVQVTPENTA